MIRFILSVSILVLFSQCRPARMALQTDSWQTKEELKVSGKRGLFTRERMSFGEYYTTEVKRSWVKGTSNKFGVGQGAVTDVDYRNIISVDYIKRKQTIKFAMANGSSLQSEVYCVSRFNTTEVLVGNNQWSALNLGIGIYQAVNDRPTNTYYVQLYTEAGSKPWELLLDNDNAQLRPRKYVGYLSKSETEYYTIVPVTQMEGKDGKPANMLFGLIGFEFRNKENKAVAAVSLIDRGVVYLQSITEQERFLLANACAALLMQENLG